MGNNISRQVECVLCSASFEPVYEPKEGEGAYRIYCSSCSKGVQIAKNDPVRVALREVLKIEGEALALAVETYLSDCPCGHRFSYDSGGRCPQCIQKIKREVRTDDSGPTDFYCIWNIKKLKEIEGRVFGYILNRLDSEEITLQQLIDSYESGQIDDATYMEGVEDIQVREATEIAVIKAWAMIAGPEMAFRAAEEHAFTDRYGTRILVSIASGLEVGYGTNILTTLTREEKNLDGPLKREIQTFIRKIAGGF